MIKNKQSRACPEYCRRGFTLVELLVSIAILLLVLGAAVSTEVQSIKLADKNKRALQATNLAQEQINLVKTVRDNNVKDTPTTPFLNFPTTPTGTPAPTETKHLTGPDANKKWGLANNSIDQVIDGVTYTIEITSPDNITPTALP